MRDALRCHGRQERRRIEARQQHERAAEMEVREHLRGLRRGVKQRQRDGGRMTAVAVVRRGAQLGRHHRVDDHVQVRQLRAFGLPRRARRIKNDGRVVRLRFAPFRKQAAGRR